MHGGHVEAVSEGPGRGSEFVVSLPRIDPQRAQCGQPASEAEKTSSPRSLRVLVVDDNPDVADSLAELVESPSPHQPR